MAKVINNAENGKTVSFSVGNFVSDNMYDALPGIRIGDSIPIEAKILRHNDLLGKLVEMLHDKGILTDHEVFREILGYFQHELEIIPD